MAQIAAEELDVALPRIRELLFDVVFLILPLRPAIPAVIVTVLFILTVVITNRIDMPAKGAQFTIDRSGDIGFGLARGDRASDVPAGAAVSEHPDR